MASEWVVVQHQLPPLGRHLWKKWRGRWVWWITIIGNSAQLCWRHSQVGFCGGLRLSKDSTGVGVKNLLGQAVVWNTSGVRARTAVPCMGTWNAASRPARPVYRLRLKQKQKWTWAGRNIRAYLPNNVWKKWHRDRWKDISLDIN